MNNIKELRIRASMTQQNLANLLKVTRQYVSAIESGKEKLSAVTIAKLQSIFNCTEEEIVKQAKIEYDEDGRLIVDCIWYDPRIPNSVVIQIENSYFLLPSYYGYNRDKAIDKNLIPMPTKLSTNATEIIQWYYIYLYNCTKRNGFNIEIGRDTLLNVQELKEAIVRKGYTQSDIANKIGISSKTFGNRLKKGSFRSDEIELMIDILEISDPMFIFFGKKDTKYRKEK